MAFNSNYLTALGVYGFKSVEPVILAALVTGDPLLLIGRSGTGKTFLLNSLSEALGLEHRHYNASMLSFDDLVGFPYPDDEKSSVRFLETPATVWGAESVLIDEISRCRPEQQNRLFSLIHERRIQGISLENLRYRWAAMNPCGLDSGADYIGSEPLDQALADRFSLILKVGDWDDLCLEDKRRVANPAGEGKVNVKNEELCQALAIWQASFQKLLEKCPSNIIDYSSAVASAFLSARIRISPRRVRLLTRSLLAATIVSGEGINEKIFLSILKCSLPQLSYEAEIPESAILAAHRLAWDTACTTGDQKWVHDFHLSNSLSAKLSLLLNSCPSEDIGSATVAEFLANGRFGHTGAFALAVYPAAAEGRVPNLNAECISDLGKIAQLALSVEGSISWYVNYRSTSYGHPKRDNWSKVVSKLTGARRERAEHLMKYLLLKIEDVSLSKSDDNYQIDFKALEGDFHKCIQILAEAHKAESKVQID